MFETSLLCIYTAFYIFGIVHVVARRPVLYWLCMVSVAHNLMAPPWGLCTPRALKVKKKRNNCWSRNRCFSYGFAR